MRQKLKSFFSDKLVIQKNKTNILTVVKKISDSEKDLVFEYDNKQPFLPFISHFHSPSHFRRHIAIKFPLLHSIVFLLVVKI